jgi:selenide,water dikinase
MVPSSRRHLIIAGGGHAHVHVLRSLAMRPEPGLRVTVISPSSYATYSGMVPGVLAGQYGLREAQIDVRALAARARAAFVADRVVRIHPEPRIVDLEHRPSLSYDLLSLDVGSRPWGADRLAGGAPVVAVKPIEVAAAGIEAALAPGAGDQEQRVVIVGAGAGGVELAFALAARLRREGGGTVTICETASEPAAERGPRTARIILDAFRRHGIEFLGATEVERADLGGVHLAGGRLLEATLIIWATGASGPAFFAESGLPVDERGFLRVGDDLRCEQYLDIFAAGDCASLRSYPSLAKAGVYAVRQGPVLGYNLRAAANGSRLRTYRPQKRFLSLLNTGDGRAILSYGGWALRGRWAWWLKDYIDRKFIARYARPPLAPDKAMAGEMIPCGGCAAKVGADVLRRVLERLEVPPAEGVLIGLDQAEDAAVFAQPPGTLAVATADAFPPFDDDLYLVGQVAAVNAASDLYAMGAEGGAAIALVCLPRGRLRDEEEGLELFLRGALAALARLDIPLAGGHTIAGEQALLGFSMHGWVRPDRVLRKSGMRPGDFLVLTKPLGTGVVLAAARAGVAAAEWMEAAHASMLRSNRSAMRMLVEHGVRACTDVTGFGLAGHLGEMLRASGSGARLRAASIPALPGARELLEAGWRSSFHAGNERAQRDGGNCDGDEALAALMVDPQTSGGLLAAVPAHTLDNLLGAFHDAGEEIHVIGEATEGPPRWQVDGAWLPAYEGGRTAS